MQHTHAVASYRLTPDGHYELTMVSSTMTLEEARQTQAHYAAHLPDNIHEIVSVEDSRRLKQTMLQHPRVRR